MKLKAYYSVLKPERTYANVMTTAAGFLLAARWHIDWQLFMTTIIGTTLIVMSACATNNCTDRNLDARMPRTKKRALVLNAIPVRNVAVLAVLLAIAGFVVLIAYVNWLVLLLGAVGYVDYVVLYAWSKRHSPYSTLIGTVSGAVPIVAGYVAVTDSFDTTALLLGLILIAWQMAHFYAIGIYRHADYAAGSLPIWPVVHGDANTRGWIIFYTTLFVASATGLNIFGTTNLIYLVGMLAIGVVWLGIALKGLRAPNLTLWARQMFFASLFVVLGTSVLIAVGSVFV